MDNVRAWVEQAVDPARSSVPSGLDATAPARSLDGPGPGGGTVDAGGLNPPASQGRTGSTPLPGTCSDQRKQARRSSWIVQPVDLRPARKVRFCTPDAHGLLTCIPCEVTCTAAGRPGPTSSTSVAIPLTGRRRQQTKSGFRTKRAAEDAMSETIGALADGSYVAPDPQTLGEWIERWLGDDRTQGSLVDAARLSGRARPCQGSARAREAPGAAPTRHRGALRVLLEDGHRYGGGLAPKTVRNVHIALRRSLADAERFGLVQRNVAALVKPPAPVRPELVTWDADDMRTFLASVHDDRNAPAYRLLATTGMRRGEALGLRWSDIDLDVGRVTINRSLTVVDSALVWSAPKTARSRRSVSLDPETVAALSVHRRHQLEERIAAGDAWDGSDLVFCDQLGGPLHPDRFTRAFGSAAASRRCQADPTARPPPHMGDARTASGHPPEGCQRTPRPLDHRHHARHLQPRATRTRRERSDNCRSALRGRWLPPQRRARRHEYLPEHSAPVLRSRLRSRRPCTTFALGASRHWRPAFRCARWPGVSGVHILRRRTT